MPLGIMGRRRVSSREAGPSRRTEEVSFSASGGHPSSSYSPTPRGMPAATKREAVGLYCTGLSLSATGRRLGVSAQSVMRWVRDHARDYCPKPAPAGRAVVVELDEMWHFV